MKFNGHFFPILKHASLLEERALFKHCLENANTSSALVYLSEFIATDDHV